MFLSKELSVSLTSASESAARPAPGLRAAGIVLAGSVFVAVCAHIALPLYFTPVPLTLQPFAVLVLGLVLSPGLAAATLATYLAEGAAGLPVFAPGLVFSGGTCLPTRLRLH
jgi:biotin transport system substrate-specific component